MKPGFPLPKLTPDWNKFRSQEAQSWKSAYAGRFQSWLQLNYILPGVVIR
jgi:hypothetical protein